MEITTKKSLVGSLGKAFAKASLALALLSNNVEAGENYLPKPVESIPVETKESGRLNVPVYSQKDVPRANCSRYIRYAGKQLFNEEYFPGNAWERKKADKFVSYVGKNPLEQLADSGVLKPGMIIAAHFPKSKFKSHDVTHVALYLGRGVNGKGLYAHEWGVRTEVTDEKRLREYGLNFKYVLDSKGGRK